MMKKTIIASLISLGIAWGQNANIPILPGITLQSLNPQPPICSTSITGVPGVQTIYYWPVANYPVGGSVVTSPVVVSNAPNTLNGSNFVQINCNLPPAATTIDLIKSTTGSISVQGTASVALATASTTGLFNDQGGALSSYTWNLAVPQYMSIRLNNRDFSPARLEFGLSSSSSSFSYGPLPITALPPIFTFASTDQNITSSTTITAPNLIGGILRVTAGTDTSTTDTAANIVAAIPGAVVGTTFELLVVNGSGLVHTLALGSGVTAAAGVTTTLTTPTATSHEFWFRVTNVATPAVVIYSLGNVGS